MRYLQLLVIRVSAVFLLMLAATNYMLAQNNDSLFIAGLYKEALRDCTSYKILQHLVTEMPGRLCGSESSLKAVEYTAAKMKDMGADTVYTQQIMVRNWKRGPKEEAALFSGGKMVFPVELCSFGMSKSTPPMGIRLLMLEVESIEELQKFPDDSVRGRIVFYNRKMNPENYYTFRSYGDIAVFRSKGVEAAAKKGAAAILVRSSTYSVDSFPHTGVMRYAAGIDSIPALSVCTRDADRISFQLKSNPKARLYVKTGCRNYPDTVSYNVVGEIKGSEFPDQYIVIGGHLDCWDNSPGAHDDGGGCVQSIEIIRLFRAVGYKPRHTIRIVMFMDEEVAQRGAKKYAEEALRKNEKHIAAIESDRGVATPMGFSADMSDTCYEALQQMIEIMEPWGIWLVFKGGSGVDITPLKPQGVPLMAIVPDSQRYFEYHHSANDTFDKVNQREMQLGSASMAALVYMIDKYGWKFKNQ
jgi:hypothetical protein